MRCLYCGKLIKEPASEIEQQTQWHMRCSKQFFGIRQIPQLDIDKSQLEHLANETVSKGLTVPGVQKKLSLHLSLAQNQNRLTIVDYPTGYILKPQTEEFPSLPEFENLAMRMAEIAGIKTVPYGLVKTKEEYAYITKRIDREIDDDQIVKMWAMEDFCQLGHRLTSDKYRGSYEQCVKIIKQYSQRVRLDLSELLIRVVFSYIIGNSDMHLKNFSLIEETPGNRQFCLSPAYDILPVNVIMPEDQEELAMPLNGKKQNLRKKDFLMLAELCGFDKKNGERLIHRICSLKDKYVTEIEESYLNKDQKEAFKRLLFERIERVEA